MRSDRVQTVSFARRTIGGTEHQSRERASVKKSFMLLYLLSFGTFNELPVPGKTRKKKRAHAHAYVLRRHKTRTKQNHTLAFCCVVCGWCDIQHTRSIYTEY